MPNGDKGYYIDANGTFVVTGNISGRKIIVTPQGVSDTPRSIILETPSNQDAGTPNPDC